MMDEIEQDRDKQKARCAQLEAQLEISQKIVDTQEAALAAKEVRKTHIMFLACSERRTGNSLLITDIDIIYVLWRCMYGVRSVSTVMIKLSLAIDISYPDFSILTYIHKATRGQFADGIDGVRKTTDKIHFVISSNGVTLPIK